MVAALTTICEIKQHPQAASLTSCCYGSEKKAIHHLTASTKRCQRSTPITRRDFRSLFYSFDARLLDNGGGWSKCNMMLSGISHRNVAEKANMFSILALTSSPSSTSRERRRRHQLEPRASLLINASCSFGEVSIALTLWRGDVSRDGLNGLQSQDRKRNSSSSKNKNKKRNIRGTRMRPVIVVGLSRRRNKHSTTNTTNKFSEWITSLEAKH